MSLLHCLSALFKYKTEKNTDTNNKSNDRTTNNYTTNENNNPAIPPHQQQRIRNVTVLRCVVVHAFYALVSALWFDFYRVSSLGWASAAGQLRHVLGSILFNTGATLDAVESTACYVDRNVWHAFHDHVSTAAHGPVPDEDGHTHSTIVINTAADGLFGAKNIMYVPDSTEHRWGGIGKENRVSV